MNRRNGFSLIELLVVISIIGLLSTMSVVSLDGARQKARDARRQGDISTLRTAIEMYKTQYSDDRVPVANNWTALSSALSNFLTAAPQDPNNTGAYTYVYCRNTLANDNGYLIAAVLEQKVEVFGDMDIKPEIAGTPDCIQSNTVENGASAVRPWASIDCADGTGSLTGSNQYVFCLGQKSLQ